MNHSFFSWHFLLENSSSVVLRDGSTSDSPLLKQYNWPIDTSTENQFQSFVTTLSSGFYVAFKGVFTPESRFAIVYTAFSYMGKVCIVFSFEFTPVIFLKCNALGIELSIGSDRTNMCPSVRNSVLDIRTEKFLSDIFFGQGFVPV